MEKLSIIIPAHNEEKRIGLTLDNYLRYFDKAAKKESLDYRIIVVINATTDKTRDIVNRFRKKSKRISFMELKEAGKGYAIREGFKEVMKSKSSRFIGFVDADMATPPEAFHDLLRKIDRYDGVIASRWLKGSIIKTKQTVLRRIMSWGFNFLVKSILFLNFQDTQCGAKLFRKEALRVIIRDMQTTGWAFDIELLYLLKKKGFKVIEVPTVWEDKRESKLPIVKTPFKMFSSIIRLRLIYSPFNFIVRSYDKLPEKMKIHNL